MRRNSIVLSISDISGAGTAASKNVRTNIKSLADEVLTVSQGLIRTNIRSGTGHEVLTPSELPGNALSFCYSVPNNPDCEGLRDQAGTILDYFSIGDKYRTQLFTPYRSTNLMFRTQDGDNNGVWNSWCKIYHTGYKPSAQDVNAFQGSVINSIDATTLPWNADSGIYSERMINPSTGGVSYTAILLHFYSKIGMSTPSIQIRAKYANGGLFYRSSRDAAGFENPFTEIFTERRPPTPQEVGIVENIFFGSAGTGGWCKVAEVTIPQNRGRSLYLHFVGSSGYNSGVFEQAASTEVFVRPGNNNSDKRITVGAFEKYNGSLFSAIAWKHVSGDTYELWVNSKTYINDVTVLKIPTDGVSVSLVTNISGALGTKPSGLTDGQISCYYHTNNEPNSVPIGVFLTWPSDTLPTGGYAFLHGQSFDKAANPKLAALFPSGTLPDTRGLVLKGKPDGRGILSIEQDFVKSHNHTGTAASVDYGTKTTNETGNHTHSFEKTWNGWPRVFYMNSGGDNGVFVNGTTGAAGNHTHTVYIGAHSHTLTIDSFGHVENTVKNIAVNFIVKLG